mmetsp:Transcript_4634/g.9778  ORF Transcript_4634/g.9778 Transcript_4634/m.9778 type:complete len:386 (+) Transcript_4634:62-1219(+)
MVIMRRAFYLFRFIFLACATAIPGHGARICVFVPHSKKYNGASHGPALRNRRRRGYGVLLSLKNNNGNDEDESNPPSSLIQPKKKRGRPPKKRQSDELPPTMSVIDAEYVDGLDAVPSSPVSPEGLNRAGRWVMIVDPSQYPPSSFPSAEILRTAGYMVTPHADQDAAWDAAERGRVAVLGEFARGNRGKAPDAPPDLLVLHAGGCSGSHETDGLRLLRRLRSSPDLSLASVPALVVSSRGLAEDRIRCRRAGADAVLVRPCEPEELVTLADSCIVRHLSVLGSLSERGRLMRELSSVRRVFRPRELPVSISERAADAGDIRLTPKEMAVLRLLCRGMTNAGIASELGNASRTIEDHVGSIFRKTNLQNRMELLRWALDTGTVET